MNNLHALTISVVLSIIIMIPVFRLWILHVREYKDGLYKLNEIYSGHRAYYEKICKEHNQKPIEGCSIETMNEHISILKS